MKSKIRIKWSASASSGVESVSLDELDVSSHEEWMNLSANEQSERLQEAIDSMNGLVVPLVDDWSSY